MALPTYSEKDMIRAQLRPSPSALYNNLTCADGNLVYAHNRSVCIFSPESVSQGTAVSVRRGDSQAKDTVYSVQACHAPGATYVVVGTDGGVQVWDKTCSTLLYVWAFPESERLPSTSTISTFARGSALVQAGDGSTSIYFGSSSGKLYAMRLDAGGQFITPRPLTHHTSPITCMGSDYQSRRADWTPASGHKFVTCDEEGGVSIWDASSAEPSIVTSITASTVPATAVAVRGDLLVVGRLDGTVHVYSLASGKVRAEISAHSRFLTALDVHPTKDIIATVAEDATINIWSLPTGDVKVQNLLSSLWMHAMPTGVAFCGAASSTVAVTALDTEEVRLFKAA